MINIRSMAPFALVLAGVGCHSAQAAEEHASANAAASSGATYELRRIEVADGREFASRCHFTPGMVKHILELGDLTSEQDIPIAQDEAAVQALVDAAPGVTPPSFDGLDKSFTNWWVRSSADAPFKLVRSNTSNNPGGSLLQDTSDAGQKLAVFMGAACFRTFGQ
jgi:hypothetical protein